MSALDAPATAPRSGDAPADPRPARQIHALVVDDSAVVREVVGGVLRRAGMRVTAASDGLLAHDAVRRERPDVIVLDLEMPRVDGMTFLRRLMAEDPIPVVICSGLAESGAASALRALDEGAVAIIAKPRVGVRDFLEDAAARLVETVRAAAATRLRRRAAAPDPGAARPEPGSRRWLSALAGRLLPRAAAPAPAPEATGRVPTPPRPLLARTTDRVVAIGASTGGTEALRRVLAEMPFDAPGIVVVQHMPEGFTAAFAASLDRACTIEVTEARSGDRIVPGRALIAPGDRHVVLRRRGGHLVLDLSDGAAVSGHRPSADVLFRSVAETAGGDAVGVLLTGMGEDGAEGLLEMRRAGAATIAQDEATSVVFGMPRAAIERGAAQNVFPLGEIGRAILRRAAAAPPTASREPTTES